MMSVDSAAATPFGCAGVAWLLLRGTIDAAKAAGRAVKRVPRALSRRCRKGSAAPTTVRWCLSGGADVARIQAEQVDSVLHESDQDIARRCPLARIAQHDWHIGI